MLNKFIEILKRITPTKWHWILDHDGYKRYFANMSWMFFGQMFSLLVSFFIGAWIARYLGPENYGILNYSSAFVGLFGFISSLGIDGILSRELIKTPEKRDELLGTAFRLKLIGGAIAFCLAIISVLFFQSEPRIKILVALFAFSFILQSINVVSNYFNAEVKSKNNVKATLISTVITSVLKVLVIVYGKGVIWLVIVFVLDSLWQGIGLVKSYNNYGLKIKNWVFSKILSKEILKNSWPLMLAAASGLIFSKIDQVLIGQMLGNYKVGIYAAAVKLVEIWYFIPVLICTSLFPAIINAKKTNHNVYKKRLKNLYLLLIVISIIISILITIFSKPIILILFGPSYLESILVLKIYIWSSVGLFLTIAVNQYLLSENMTKTTFLLNLLAMIVNIVLNLLLIPILGLIGASLATLISCFILPLIVLSTRKDIIN
jgi:O-antigen/teichoic acid export membrane protein